jgi:periplasmic protein TonB
MEAKKNPSKDVHRMSGIFFQIGLGVSLLIIITAFEWRTEVKKVSFRVMDESPTDWIIPIPPTDPKEPPPPSLIKNESKPIINPISTTPIALTTTKDESTDDQTPTLDPSLMPDTPFTPLADDREPCGECFELFPEKAAEPIGGYEAFYKLLKANLKYPRNAARMNIDGRVFVEFIVNRDGTPVEMKVVRGIGFGFDEEAKRVIGLTRWNPGKQRGRPVRVKMVLPIVFMLN